MDENIYAYGFSDRLQKLVQDIYTGRLEVIMRTRGKAWMQASEGATRMAGVERFVVSYWKKKHKLTFFFQSSLRIKFL